MVSRFLMPVTISAVLAFSAPAAVLLDDGWEDGDRTDTNLPDESAWFGSMTSGTATLSAAPGALTGNVLMFGTNTSSRLWITHFAPAGSPAELNVGDTLKVTLMFVASGVSSSNTTSRGLRLGLFNFSEPGAGQASMDGFSTGAGSGAPGTNVRGYMLNMNFGQTFATIPLQLMKRTDLATNNLMGALAVYTGLSSGGGTSGNPGFSNGVPYTFEFIIRRLATSVEITTKFSDTNGWSISHTASDANNPTFRFDGFAMRPNSVLDSAESFTFTQFKAELIPHELRITSIRLGTPEGVTVTWDSIPGESYQVEWRDSFEVEGWSPVGSIVADEHSESIEDPGPLWPQRFYRVVQF